LYHLPNLVLPIFESRALEVIVPRPEKTLSSQSTKKLYNIRTKHKKTDRYLDGLFFGCLATEIDDISFFLKNIIHYTRKDNLRSYYSKKQIKIKQKYIAYRNGD